MVSPVAWFFNAVPGVFLISIFEFLIVLQTFNAVFTHSGLSFNS
ncbi:Uncharacterised protein [Yersinia enterocolitica]|nr:Uncharacterised protein [Yersinia enterocolitica]